jgi:uncharacterized membrane protein (DUF4010 family)
MDLTPAARLAVAALGGAAIGLERQWSGHASGPQARFGGIRTFTLLGVIGGLSGWIGAGDLIPVAALLVAAAAAIIVAGYVAASRADVDGTTEIAALVVLAAGVLTGAGQLALASGVVAATTVLLLEKSRLHTLVTRIDEAALRASARFAALALIVLPLLPAGPYGPLDAIRPRELWVLVLFFSGLSFGGWVARHLIGPRHGVIVSGLLGGIISSTAVTLTFARQSRGADAPRLALAAGAIGACTVMLVRVAVACAVLNPALAITVPRYCGVAFAIGAATLLAIWRIDRSSPPTSTQPMDDSPLQLRAALQMTALFQLVLFVIVAVQARWGSTALIATSALVGLTDLDALTLSLARSAATPPMLETAGAALAAGVLANTLLKLVVAVVVGRGSFRVATTGALGAMAMAIVVGLLLIP